MITTSCSSLPQSSDTQSMISSLETEVGKLECLFVIDPNFFEEFLQENCPILYDLAHTYALLKELEDITNKKE